MSHPLEYIIRNVKSDTIPNSNDEVILFYDKRKKKVLDKQPLITIWSLERYLINFRKSAICKGLTQKVNDFPTSRYINLKIDYEAKLARENASTAILALSEGDSTGVALDKILKEEVLDFCDKKSKDGIDVIHQFYQVVQNNNTLKNELQSHLENIIELKTGLNLRVSVFPDGLKKLKSIEIKSRENFSIRTNDWGEKIPLKFEAKLDIDKENKMNAVTRNNSIDELVKIIQAEISSFFLKNVSLHDFYYKINRSIRKQILEKVNSRLKKYGRSISFIVFELDRSNIKPEELPITNFTASCEIKEYPDPVKVKNRVSMHISNLGKFKNSGVKDLKKWVDNKLGRITKDTLFYKTYTDILLETNHPSENSYENIIRDKMKVEVEKIGYNIEQLLVIPNLKPLKLKDGFKIEKTDTYATDDEGVFVNLEIIINGKILDLNKIQKYLNPKINIKSVIRKKASEEVEHIINKTSSHRVYMEFYEGSPSLKEELLTKIEEKLVQEFHISDLSIIFKSLETPISKRFKDLRKNSNRFSFDVIPASGEGYFAQAVNFVRVFRVLGVVDWATFQARDFQSVKKEVKAMKKALSDAIKKKLRQFSGEVLQSNDPNVLREIDEKVKIYSREVIEKEFGLNIEISHFDRAELLSETEQLKTINKAIIGREELKQGNNKLILGSSHEQLASLLRKEKQLVDLGYGDSYKKLVKVRKKIKKLSENLPDTIIGNKSNNEETKHLPSGVFTQKKGEESDNSEG